MKPVLVTSYANPDLDGVAGAIAYSEFLQKTGTDVIVKFVGEPQDEAKYMFSHFGFGCPEIIPTADNFNGIILVDVSDLNELEGKIAAEKVIEIIDHRKVNEADKFPKAKVQIELVGAASTLIAEKFMHSKIELSKESATLLYGAIISNTFNFKGDITTDRDRKAAAWLNQIAKLPGDFWRELFVAKSDLTGKRLVERIRSDFAWFTISDKKVGIAQIEMIGAKKLIDERGEEIVAVLKKIKKERGLDLIFQNTVELGDMKAFFVADEPETQQLLEKVLDVRFSGIVAERPDAIMRKQIVPLLKGALG